MPLTYLVGGGGPDWGTSAEGAVIRRAHRMIDIAHVGLADLAADDPHRRVHGACSVTVFGRSVTFVLQNLRATRREEFDTWYAPREEEMRQDELLRYFHHLRSHILKEGGPDFVYRGFYREIASSVEEAPIMAEEYAPAYFGFDVANPASHLGQPLAPETSLADLGSMYLAYLWRLITDAAAEFIRETPSDTTERAGRPFT